MNISLNIILDALREYHIETRIPEGRQPSFIKCLPLPDERVALRGDCLYVGSLSGALTVCGCDPDICCICRRDRIEDEAESEEALAGKVVVNENIPIQLLFTVVQDRFFAIIDWVQQMHETLIHDGTMQDILDQSALIIGNHIAISDSSLMLMAYTRDIPCDDPISVALVEYGYHPDETIQKFKKYDLFKTWEMATAMYSDETCAVAKYVTLHKIFKFGNMYFAHVVMSCNRSPLSPCIADLFKILVDVLAVCVERAWEAKNACNHIYDTFLTDLIEGNLTNKSVIEERAQYVGIPAAGPFCLFHVVSSDTANLSIGKMLVEFTDTFPKFKFIRYQKCIIAINHFSARNTEEQLKSICESMESFLEKYDAMCGVSLFFSSLDGVPYAFKQASLALKYVGKMRGGALVKDIRVSAKADTRVHRFNDKFLFCLIGENEENAELWYHSEFHKHMRTLYQYDQRHKSNDLLLLHIYLVCERNATNAAETLNMHRNNVKYHINKIQEILGVDLDDPGVRFMFSISFVLMELYGLDNG